VAFASLVAAGLMLAPALGSAADRIGPPGPEAGEPANADDRGASSGRHAGDPRDRVSPYARVAREHQQVVGPKRGRRLGHAPGAGGRTRR
jgi:hypothetical protein